LIAMLAPRLLVVGYLSFDTVVQADGRARRQAGGAGLYAALGARLGGAAVDLAASLGEDFPADWLRALAAAGVGLAHLDRKSAPSRRARLVHAAAGDRRSTHFGDPEWQEATRLHVPRAPADLGAYGLVVAAPMPVEALAELVAAAEAAGVSVVADVSEASAENEAAALMALVPRLSVFAPSREETRLLLPGLDDDEATRRLARLGPAVVQKRGPEGAFCVENGAAWNLPAPPTRVVDPTGAGDAAVGALAAARLAGCDLDAATRRALAVGALAVAGHGPAALCPALAPVSLVPEGALAR
jgi:sugar/nucleoside kinase (ribokinase family)